MPLVAGTKTFSTVLLMLKACSFLPLLVTALFPRKWGKEFARSSDDTHSLNILFQALAVASLVFHVKTTAAGLLFNLPNSHRHRHFISIPFDIEKRSTLERSTTAMGKILGSMSDHPVVAGAAADVLLTTLGLGLWSAFGSVDVGTMLASAVPGYRRVSRGLLACKHELQDTVTSHPAESIVADTASSASHLSRRLRGRQSASDTVHKSNPSVQDEGETASKPKRRGRPRKVKREEETMVEEPGDGAYQPPAADVGSSCQGGAMLEEDPDWEAAALSWGLVALAGLGTGSTAVFGAECVPP